MTAPNLDHSTKPVIGLIGGIGSGKSQVAAAFAEHGAAIIAGDALAHEALRQPDLRQRIVERWGQDLLNEQEEIDRRRLGAIVFAQAAARKELEALVHPWIRQRIQEEVARAQADPRVPLIVLDAAIMLEAGWSGVCDRLVFIEAPRALRLQRLAAQRGWRADEVVLREKAQLPLTEKAAQADHVIENSATLDHLSHQVEHLLQRWGLTPSR